MHYRTGYNYRFLTPRVALAELDMNPDQAYYSLRVATRSNAR